MAEIIDLFMILTNMMVVVSVLIRMDMEVTVIVIKTIVIVLPKSMVVDTIMDLIKNVVMGIAVNMWVLLDMY